MKVTPVLVLGAGSSGLIEANDITVLAIANVLSSAQQLNGDRLQITPARDTDLYYLANGFPNLLFPEEEPPRV